MFKMKQRCCKPDFVSYLNHVCMIKTYIISVKRYLFHSHQRSMGESGCRGSCMIVDSGLKADEVFAGNAATKLPMSYRRKYYNWSHKCCRAVPPGLKPFLRSATRA